MEYTEKWGDILKPYKNKTKNYLEIGLYRGVTLPWWKDYFDCEVYGIDIDLTNLEIDKNKFHVYEADASDPNKIPTDFASIKFDVIVDDSDPKLHYKIFEIYQSFLSEGGIYIIETYKPHNTTRPIYSLLSDYVKLIKNYKNFSFHIGQSHLSKQQIIYGYKKC